MWFTKSRKSFEKIEILRTWQLVFFFDVKTYFSTLPLKWRIFRREKIYFHKYFPVIQGLSTGIDIFWRPRRPTINNFLVKMNVSAYFWGLGIWVSPTKFWKNNIGWPQQPPSERVPYISEKLDFWWSIPKKMTIIGHFGALDDQTIRIKIIFEGIEL